MSESQTVVITGAASGIGRAWSEGFHREGNTVIAADINEVGLAELESQGVHTVTTDVTDANAVRNMIDMALDTSGRIDVLFNNAGVGIRTRIEDLSDGEFEHHVAIHLFGVVHGMRFAIPHMRKQGYGRIINTISRAAEFAAPLHSAYAAAKAGIWAASRSAAKEVEDANILINMLIPGPTNTAIWRRDMPSLQKPEVTFPTAKMLATLPDDGPRATVFWDEKPYALFSPDNEHPARQVEIRKLLGKFPE